MTLSLHPVRMEDIPRIVAISCAGLAAAPFHSSLWPNGVSSTAMKQLIAKDTHDLQTKHNISWICIRDASINNEIIAVAKWRLEDAKSYEEKKRETMSSSPEGMCKEAAEAFSRANSGTLRDVMSSREFWHLGTLVTDPQHERRGAGKMLVEWGCRRADTAGLKCSLHATPGGKKLYLACGFQVISEEEVDLRPYGGVSIVESTTMVREPRRGDLSTTL